MPAVPPSAAAASESTVQNGLASWVQSHLTAIYEASSEDKFEEAFESAISPKASIQVNHEALERDDLKRKLGLKGFANAGSTTKWDNVIEGAPDGETQEDVEEKFKQDGSGVVAGYLVVTHNSKLRIRGGPAQTQTFIHVSAKVANDPNIPADTPGDHRRIVSFFQTSVNKRVPINFNHIPAQTHTQ